MFYAHPAHLSLEDGELRNYADVSWARQLQLASRDVELDLQRRGLCADRIPLTATRAVAKIDLTNTGDEPLMLARGFVVYSGAEDCSQWSQLWFTFDDDVTVEPRHTETIEVTATHWGTPWNVDRNHIIQVLDPDVAASVQLEQSTPAVFGTDHLLSRATVYRALELIYGDLTRSPDDIFDHKRRIYARRYTEELDRLQQAGLPRAGGERKNYGAARLIRG